MTRDIRQAHYKMQEGRGCRRIQPLCHVLVFWIYLVYTCIYLVYSLNDISFSVPAAFAFMCCFVCSCLWHDFGQRNDGGWGRTVCVPCMSGTAISSYFQFQACPARPYAQEQESEVCIRMEQNKTNYSSRRCNCRWIWWNGTLPSSAIPAAENTHTILSKCMDYVM